MKSFIRRIMEISENIKDFINRMIPWVFLITVITLLVLQFAGIVDVFAIFPWIANNLLTFFLWVIGVLVGLFLLICFSPAVIIIAILAVVLLVIIFLVGVIGSIL